MTQDYKTMTLIMLETLGYFHYQLTCQLVYKTKIKRHACGNLINAMLIRK